jgi:mitochondrial Rho GTPase 1
VLYDSNKEQLQPDCVKALERVFRLCDFDLDGALADEEMDYFQERCFGKKLDKQQASDLKKLVRESLTNGVTANGITLEGFVFLHHMLMQKGHPERVWTVLRKVTTPIDC